MNTTITRSIRDWERLGSEAEGADRRAGNVSAITDADLRGVLADHFEADLSNPEICEDCTTALDALVSGYRRGA
jgi:hypothetical protein